MITLNNHVLQLVSFHNAIMAAAIPKFYMTTQQLFCFFAC